MKRSLYQRIDCLLIDEGAQALESEILIPFNLVPSNLIIIGDPNQLSATIMSSEIQSKQLGLSIMSRLNEKCDYPMSLLDTQYRMHKEIVEFPNRVFYGIYVILLF